MRVLLINFILLNSATLFPGVTCAHGNLKEETTKGKVHHWRDRGNRDLRSSWKATFQSPINSIHQTIAAYPQTEANFPSRNEFSISGAGNPTQSPRFQRQIRQPIVAGASGAFLRNRFTERKSRPSDGNSVEKKFCADKNGCDGREEKNNLQCLVAALPNGTADAKFWRQSFLTTSEKLDILARDGKDQRIQIKSLSRISSSRDRDINQLKGELASLRRWSDQVGANLSEMSRRRGEAESMIVVLTERMEELKRSFHSLRRTDRPGCPGGFLPHDDSCYLVVTVPAAWSDARKFCERFRADLVAIETAEENDFLVLYFASNRELNQLPFWTSGSDVKIEGQWRWTQSKQSLSTRHWSRGEPNGGRGENCLELRASTSGGYAASARRATVGGVGNRLPAKRTAPGAWNDQDCAKTIPFVCEAKR